jgi:5-methylcytosine-specific restriction endonuclease McrA
VNEAKCRAIVKARSNLICEICGRKRGEQMHHRKNRSQSGKWTPSNILNLCVLCHHETTVSPRTAAKLGHTVLSFENPLEKPVLLFHGGVRRRVLLDDLGGVTPLWEAA